MPRGRKIVKVIKIEECSVCVASEEFYTHNHIKGLSPATQKGYKDYINAFMKWLGKETLLSEITSRVLEKYMVYCEEKGNKPVSIATTMVHLRRFFKFCNSRG